MDAHNNAPISPKASSFSESNIFKQAWIRIRKNPDEHMSLVLYSDTSRPKAKGHKVLSINMSVLVHIVPILCGDDNLAKLKSLI